MTIETVENILKRILKILEESESNSLRTKLDVYLSISDSIQYYDKERVLRKLFDVEEEEKC